MDQTVMLTLAFFVASILYSSVGHAGASGYLAAMALFSLAPAAMRPTALVMNVLVASIATVRFYRAGCFSWRTLWPFAATSIPFAFIGGALTLPSPVYKGIVGVVLLIAAVKLASDAARQSDPNAEGQALASVVPVVPALAWGAALGLLAGLTGTGGGIFLSPLLLFLGWAETRKTSGVSAAFILVNSIAGLAGTLGSLSSLPTAIYGWCGAVVAGGLIGSELGAQRLVTRWLRFLLAAVLTIAALKLIGAMFTP
jgi:uncharacterized protein